MNQLNQLNIFRVSGDKKLVQEIKEFFETAKTRRCKMPRDLEFYRIKSADLLMSYDEKWIYVFKDDHFHRCKINDEIQVKIDLLLNL